MSLGPYLTQSWGTFASKVYPTTVVHHDGAQQPLTYTRYTYHKFRPLNGKTASIKGWREPTLHRTYCHKATPFPGPFSYVCENTVGLRILHKGDQGFPPSGMDLLAVSGSGNYPIENGDRAIATNKCLQKMKDGSVSAGTAVAELNRTIAMIVGLIQDIATLTKRADNLLKSHKIARRVRETLNQMKVSRHYRTKVRRMLGKKLADNWLQYQYGLKPLVSDIYDLAQQFTTTSRYGRLYMHSIGQSSSFTALPALAPFNPGALASLTGTRQHGAKVRVDFSVGNAMLYQYDAMGLVNPLALGWELLPFSFVIDWLLPIGPFLQGLTAHWGTTFKGASTTVWCHVKARAVWTVYRYYYGPPIACDIENSATWRAPSGPPFPKFYIKNPLNSTTRLVTALALLRQLKH